MLFLVARLLPGIARGQWLEASAGLLAQWGLTMPDQRLLSLARECRDRAEELFVKAETFKDADAKHRMREIAVKYDELAEKLERASADT